MKQGNCETCHHWDDNLIEGMCSECRTRYICSDQKCHVIGIAGPAHCGKDTVADYLVKHAPQYHKVSFADPMKTMLGVGLGLTKEQLYGDLKETVDDRYGCSPRHMMQTIGTEWGREMIDPDIWVKAMLHHIHEPVIIPDVRFENEAAFVREHGTLIHIAGRDQGVGADHVSEAGVELQPGELVVVNDSSIAELYKQLDVIIEQL